MWCLIFSSFSPSFSSTDLSKFITLEIRDDRELEVDDQMIKYPPSFFYKTCFSTSKNLTIICNFLGHCRVSVQNCLSSFQSRFEVTERWMMGSVFELYFYSLYCLNLPLFSVLLSPNLPVLNRSKLPLQWEAFPGGPGIKMRSGVDGS